MEENHIYTTSNVPRACYRNVDDTFAITSHYLGKTLQKLNDFNENIEFTMKTTSKGSVLFLDCIISLHERREIITKYLENQLT